MVHLLLRNHVDTKKEEDSSRWKREAESRAHVDDLI